MFQLWFLSPAFEPIWLYDEILIKTSLKLFLSAIKKFVFVIETEKFFSFWKFFD